MDSPILNEGAKAETNKIHDFRIKLLQPGLIDQVKDYVLWQAAMRDSKSPVDFWSTIPYRGPVSINLDLTTACNYSCPHCVDKDWLNKGQPFSSERLTASLENMVENGLRSVVLIGGGEPTLARNFGAVVKLLKEKNVSLGIVTNGSGMEKIREVGQYFNPETRDYVRLSLDSATDETFQRMHRLKIKKTLSEIHQDVYRFKQEFPQVPVGYSFIVTWHGAHINNEDIIPNSHEMVEAARLAKEHAFDYISFKPFLDRDPVHHAEKPGIDLNTSQYVEVMEQVKGNILLSRKLYQDCSFRVVEGNNLDVLSSDLLNGTAKAQDYMRQPQQCHMTYFRNVLSPLGVSICPVYRDPRNFGSKLGNRDFYHPDNTSQSPSSVARNIVTFDASTNCSQVVCAYNPANKMLEKLIEDVRREGPAVLDRLQPSEERGDYFL